MKNRITPGECAFVYQRLRNAGPEDMGPAFLWRNDPWLISENPGLVSVDWEDHVVWFSEVLDTNSHQLFIIESQDGTGMGMVRLDKAGKTRAIITIHMNRSCVGKGYGVVAIVDACGMSFEMWPWMKSIHAYIRKDNKRSIRAFEKAGFSAVRRRNESIFVLSEMVIHR